jgi:hypothetical protein
MKDGAGENQLQNAVVADLEMPESRRWRTAETNCGFNPSMQQVG